MRPGWKDRPTQRSSAWPAKYITISQFSNVDFFGRLAVVAQKLAKNINILDIKTSVLLAGCSASFERLPKISAF